MQDAWIEMLKQDAWIVMVEMDRFVFPRVDATLTAILGEVKIPHTNWIGGRSSKMHGSRWRYTNWIEGRSSKMHGT